MVPVENDPFACKRQGDLSWFVMQFFCSSWTPSEKSWSICAATSFNLCPFSSWWRRARHSSIQSMTERIPLVSKFRHPHPHRGFTLHSPKPMFCCHAPWPWWSGAWEKRRELSGLHPRLQAFQRKVPSQAIASRDGVSTCFPSDFLPDATVFAPRKAAETRESKVWATPRTRGCWLFTLWKCRALVFKRSPCWIVLDPQLLFAAELF